MSCSQEPIDQIQPNLVENMTGGWDFRFIQMKAPNKGQNKDTFFL